MKTNRASRIMGSLATAAVLATAPLMVAPAAAHADPATANVVDRTATSGVTADALPTTQIDGVAWSQQIVGNTVYVGGEFANARPAGAAAGTNLTPRANLLAYDVTTGALVTSFQADTDAAVKALALSPDKSRLYVGGSFTTIGGQTHYRVAAIDTATGQVVASFAPKLDATVNAITVTNTAVYVGGVFSQANGTARSRLAAFDPSTGALLGWAPTTNSNVNALTQTPDASRIIIGGLFSTVNGATAKGSASVDATTGATQPWAFNQTVTNNGTNAGIFSLTNDGKFIIATAFAYSTSGYEGVAMIDPMTGKVVWLNDCHGDSYSATVAQNLVYVASHEHNCANMGSFPQQTTNLYKRATAFTYDATSTVQTNTQSGYSNFAGNPAPSQVDWFPELAAGTYTGESQAAWSVTSNDTYVVFGGEFPTVNGTPQQGLVRFAVPGSSTNKQGPLLGGTETQPRIAVNGTTATLSWNTSWDRDNENLSYQVYRDDRSSSPVATVKADSLWWDRPTVSWTDTGLVAGKAYTYWVWATDADGNRIRSNNTTITAGASSASSTYLAGVLSANPQHYWRLDEASGTTAADQVGSDPITLGTGATRNAAGVLADDTATTFNGASSSGGYAANSEVAGNTYSSEAWIKTSSYWGGVIMNMGSSKTGMSSSYDRMMYMADGGKLGYSLNVNGTRRSVMSGKSYNDGAWHHVVTTLSSAGMKLYVDGSLVASNASYTTGSAMSGYWRLGGDRTLSVPSAPISSWFTGTIDEAAVYPKALDVATIRLHARNGGVTVANTAPTASFTAACTAGTCSFDGTGSTDAESSVGYAWDFGDGSTSTDAKPSHTYTAGGTYTVKLTVTDDMGVTDSTTQQVTVTLPNQAPTASFVASSEGTTLSVDGSASTDADGSVEKWSWDFGDGSTDTGVTAQHTYAAPGTYTVTLTAADNQGATGTVTKQVTVLANGTIVASDDFSGTRTRWGTAQVGGSWTYPSGVANFSTAGGSGQMVLAAGGTDSAALAQVSGTDTSATVDVSIDKVTTGGGVNVMLASRRTTAGEYRAKLRLLSDGTARIAVTKVVGGTETVLKESVVPGGYQVGSVLHVQFDVAGTGTTKISASAWSGDVAPATPLASATDTEAGLQAAGSFGLLGYASASATTAPFTVSVNNLKVVRTA